MQSRILVNRECLNLMFQAFDSIDFGKVYGVMCELGFSKPATTLLTNICTHNSILPQGAPTSPQISNLVMKKI